MTKQISKDPFEVAFEQEDYDEDVEEEEPQPQSQQQQQNHQSDEEDSEEEEDENKKEKSSPSQPHEGSPQTDEIRVHNTQMVPSNKVEYDNTDDYDEDYDGQLNNNNNLPSSSTQINNNNNNNNKKKRKLNPSSGEQQQTTGKNKEDEEEEEEDNMDVELGKFNSSGDPDKMAKMQAILSQFTEEQMSRYESFRRSGFQKANMKKLLASITGSPKISVPMTIVVSGIAKMFVGELVETGRIVMTERGETGPIRPCHIREAYRRLKLEGKVPKKSVPRLFR